MDKPEISTNGVNKGANNLSTGMADRNRGADNTGIGIKIADKEADNLDTSIANTDDNKIAKNFGTRTIDANRADNLGKNADGRADGQTTASNKARFILVFFFESEIVSISLFVSSLSPVTLIKYETPFSRYLIAKMWMLSLSRILLIMTSMLMLLKFFARYF